ncbi:MAG: hypothetical protein H7Z43_05785 [Clostridia bacterium]|nr:hypothetical protein [Deltaproteobacteria bacterium]
MLLTLVAVTLSAPLPKATPPAFADTKIVEQGARLPAGLTAKGTLVAVGSYTDKNGETVVYIETVENEIHAYGLVKKDEWKQLWQAADGCKTGTATISYKPGSLQVTDLDTDSLAESSFAYEVSCSDAPGPLQLKVLMYESAMRYALRGTQRVFSGGVPSGGDFKPDTALQGASMQFKKFMTDQWDRLLNKS